MAMNFKEATLNTQVVERTENGMKTFHSSLNKNVDLFFQIGASRGKDITSQFESAYQEDRVQAMRILFWARDVRGGAGERELFRQVIRYIETAHVTELPQIIALVSEYGRYDDLLGFTTETGKKLAYDQIKKALGAGDGLCAKWMPRKGAVAAELRKHLDLAPKAYRKMLVNLTKVVETQMCAKDWTGINYGHVPSVAAARYQKAFGRHDAAGYTAYREKLSTGEAKINAAAVYPYDVIKSLKHGDAIVAMAQWDALPNYIGDGMVLPMVDVSGSMGCTVGGNANLHCIDVALSLGLYLADKNTGAYKDMFLTFSERSHIQVLKGNLQEKMVQMNESEWGMNTNLHAAFDAILHVATTNKLTQAELPKFMLILSDMEFDQCAKHDDSAMQMIDRKFAGAGYERPNIIFWNLNARSGNAPIRYDQSGAALVSGFSPAIMTSILAADDINPVSIMLQTLNSPRYITIQ